MKHLFFILVFCLASTQSRSQSLWGVTSSGGANSLGTIFKTDLLGANHTVVYNFQSNALGADPTGYLVQAPNGNLYGLTQAGGKYGKGVIFEFNPISFVYSIIVDFNEYRCVSLTLHPNGKMYGPGIRDVLHSVGVIIEFDPATNELSAKADFEESSTGAYPEGELLLASNGKFYGVTSQGGRNSKGVFFEYDPISNALISRSYFGDKRLRSSSSNSLIQASNGNIFGFASSESFDHVLFEFDIASNLLSKIAELDSSPIGRLIGLSNSLYSIAIGGPSGTGAILEFDIANASVTEMVDFSSYSSMPASGLSRDFLFYAFTSGHTSLFSFLAPSAIGELVDLETVHGIMPLGEPLRHSNGKIYGLTNEGIFEFNPQSNSIIYKRYFSYHTDGGEPRGSLTHHPNGKFYGVTQRSGENNLGVIFEFNPNSNSYETIATFNGTSNGAVPYSDLVLAKNGKLYGTTFNGGIHNEGVIFEIDPYSNNLVSKIVDLDDAIAGRPSQGLFAHSNGKLYGVAVNGVTGYGVIFEFDPDTGTLIGKADLHETLGSPSSGWGFRSTFTELSNGKLLAVTTSSGNGGMGCIFEFDTNTGSISKKLDFAEHFGITGNLVPHPNGRFYAISGFGSKLYEYDLLHNEIKVMVDFESNPDYGSGLSSLTLNPADYNLYGMALSRGANNLGTIFKYDPADRTLTKTFDFDFVNGANPTGDLIFVKGGQDISFDALPNKTYGDSPFHLNATASSGLDVTYVSSDPTIAYINDASVTILKAGTVTIAAEQPGNDIYSSAQPVNRDLSIAKASQTISFGELAAVDLEQGFLELFATASSSLAVDFVSTNPTIASVTGTVVSLHEPGTVTITANQSGNTNFLAADPVSRDLVIQKIVGLANHESNVLVFPNPVLDRLTVITDEQLIELSVLSASGRLLYQAGENQLNLGELPSGIYFLKIQTRSNLCFKMFMKK